MSKGFGFLEVNTEKDFEKVLNKKLSDSLYYELSCWPLDTGEESL